MDTFTVLSEPSRRRLLSALLRGPLPVNALVAQCGMSQPVVSKHLRVLREAGLVGVQPDGQQRLYSLNAQPLAEVDAWIRPYREFWANRLDALEQHLSERQGPQGEDNDCGK
jgi:DNA-binding transcriptional ArsR family regulator